MTRLIATFALAALLPAPVLAGPAAAKKPICQATKVPSRDVKRIEYCRRSTEIPPVVDPTPLFLAATRPTVIAPPRPIITLVPTISRNSQ